MIAAEAERSIRDLYARAIHAFDAGDHAWLDHWIEDGVFLFPGNPETGMPEMRLEGREQLAGMIEQAKAMMQGRALHHFTNLVFDETDDGVRVRGYLMLVANAETLAEPSAIRQNMRIDDLVVERGGRWLFARRSVLAT